MGIKATNPLTRFTGKTTMIMGTIKLPIYIGGITKIVKFSILDKPAIYNMILGTPWIHAMGLVASSYHQCVKFPTPNGAYSIRGNQRMFRTCFISERRRARRVPSSEHFYIRLVDRRYGRNISKKHNSRAERKSDL